MPKKYNMICAHSDDEVIFFIKNIDFLTSFDKNLIHLLNIFFLN
jgi:hypothetical protein